MCKAANDPSLAESEFALLHLPDVTICCIDTRSHELALRALRQSLRGCRFGRVLLISDAHAKRHDLSGIELVEIAPIRNINDYSRFAIKDLHNHIMTTHALLIQWDGFITHPDCWDSRFLDYDYVGAPWVHSEFAGAVGNGGFSLRSRKLLLALTDPRVAPAHPEDVCICVNNRTYLEVRHGIAFPPTDLAARFACERGELKDTFGFHGFFNFDRVLTADQLSIFLDELPPALATSADARDLIKRLKTKGDVKNALKLIQKRSMAQGATWDNIQLALRVHLSRLV